MATVNKASVREEIARVAQEISLLSETRKVSDESRMLFNTLLMIVNMLVVIFMDGSTKRNSKNSRDCIVDRDAQSEQYSLQEKGDGRIWTGRPRGFMDCPG